MKRVVFSPAAKADLVEIADYIGRANPSAARQLVTDIRKACEDIARLPSLGHRRADLVADPEVLFYCVRTYYLVIYREGSQPLEIARVLHGARDVAREFGEGE
jgi:toxin ParE1/3/4